MQNTAGGAISFSHESTAQSRISTRFVKGWFLTVDKGKIINHPLATMISTKSFLVVEAIIFNVDLLIIENVVAGLV